VTSLWNPSWEHTTHAALDLFIASVGAARPAPSSIGALRIHRKWEFPDEDDWTDFKPPSQKRNEKKFVNSSSHTHRVSELEFRWIFHRTKFPSTREAREWLAQWSLEPVDLFTFMCVRLCIYPLHKAAGSWCLQGRKESSEREREITKGKSQSFFSPALRVRIYITYNGAHHTNYPGDYSARFHVDGRSAPVLLSFLFSLSLSPACSSRQKREEEESESYQNSVDKNSDNNAIEREREMYTVRVKFDC
jgi:hypothetical protein